MKIIRHPARVSLVLGTVLIVGSLVAYLSGHENASDPLALAGTKVAPTPALAAPSASPPSSYPMTSPGAKPVTGLRKVPPAIQLLQKDRNRNAPMDEPLGGRTWRGTPVAYRTPDCFPAETRDLFWQMDKVASGQNGMLEPLNFDKNGDGVIDDKERDAIRGRNTWVLWGGGNESFWGWLTEDGYGLSDFMIMIDSRQRAQRFEIMGAMNQPGFKSNNNRRVLGLYFDELKTVPKLPVPADDTPEKKEAREKEEQALLLKDLYGARFDKPDKKAERESPPSPHPMRLIPTEGAMVPDWDPMTGVTKVDPQTGKPRPDRPVDELIKEVLAALPRDGVDTTVYGYPTGIIGLRLLLNPDFFGNTSEADKARRYWQKQVLQTNDRYYTDPAINADRNLVRPFRLSMSCGYCHVGPHPLNPPEKPNEPEWENLSNIIGNQYWQARPCIGNLPKADSILHHFLLSQEPGTVDTSGFSPDQINNANTINGVFQINARLVRATLNPRETQSVDNLRLMNLEEGLPAVLNATKPEDRRTARVLLDGSDSIGAFAALARVYLNIGTFSEYWNTRTNPLLGFTKHKVLDLKTCQSNSVYWMVNERERAGYLAAFFTFERKATPPKAPPPAATTTPPAYATTPPPSLAAQSATGPMKLRHALQGGAISPAALGTPEQRIAGRRVWMNNCSICHSSKQPDGFELQFDRHPKWAGEKEVKWTDAPDPGNAVYTLPMDAVEWTSFKNSKAFRSYLKKLTDLVNAEGGGAANLDKDPWTDDHPFWENNYLSTDIRVPITLVGTNAARGLGTNAIRGNVWDNLSSDTYKGLPAIGDIIYYDPFKGGTSRFSAPGGGVGYYRPNTHVALWATGPFLHNNTLGFYTEDPSVEGRLVAFEDGIRRMLWVDARSSPYLQIKSMPIPERFKDRRNRRVGDLRRDDNLGPAANDAGYIYRLPNDAGVHFAPSFVRPLIAGVAGPFITSALEWWGWLVLLAGLFWIYCRFRVRHAGILFLVLAGLSLLLLTSTGMTGGGTTTGALLAGAVTLLKWSSTTWFVLFVVLLLVAILLLMVPTEKSKKEEEESRREDRPDHPQVARQVIIIVFAGVFISLVLSGALWPWGIMVFIVGALLAWRWKWGLKKLLRSAIVLPLIAINIAGGWTANRFINGKKILHIPLANVDIGPLPVEAGPFPRGMPLNLLLNANPDSGDLGRGLASAFIALAKIKKEGLQGEAAYEVLKKEAGEALLKASKCPDLVLDRGHLFGEQLTDDQGHPLPSTENDAAKEALITFLMTL